MDPGLAYQLCLDLGKTRTGYAAFNAGKLTYYGSVRHRGASDAQLFTRTYALLTKIATKIEQDGLTLDMIAFEAAEHQAGRAAEVYFTMATAVKVFAAKRGIKAYKVYSSSMKKIVGGKGDAKTKKPIIKRVEEKYNLGLDYRDSTVNSDLADAIAVGLTAIELFKKNMLREVP